MPPAKRRLPLVAVLGALGLVAAAAWPQIPSHPDHLRFEASPFAPPDPAGMRFELTNGMPVYVVPDRNLPLVDVVLALPVGDLHERSGEAGLASMTAAMLRRGGAGALEPDRLDDEIDVLGARIVTVGASTRSVIALDCGSEALEPGLDLLASIAREPRFDEERVAQARRNLQVSLAADDDDPRRLLEREWLRLVHGDAAPRGRRLAPDDVDAFTPDALAGFHRRHYGPAGAVVAVSGDVDAEAVVRRLDELFGDWTAPGRGDASASRSGDDGSDSRPGHGDGTAALPADGSDPRPGPGDDSASRSGDDGSDSPPGRAVLRPGRRPAQLRSARTGERLGADDRRRPGADAPDTHRGGRPTPAASMPGWWSIDRPGVQAAIAVGHRGAWFDSRDDPDSWDDPGRWALMLLTEILDGPGAVSRLRARLRLGEGLVYRVLTYFDLDPPRPAARPQHAGEFRVFLETAPESAGEAASAVLEELRRLQRDVVPAAELETAKRSVLARFPLLFDRAEAVAGRYAEDELLGRPHEYWAVYRERIGAVSAADVRRAARRFLDADGVAILVVGDREAVIRGSGSRIRWRDPRQPRALGEG